MSQDVLSTPTVSCMSCANKIEDALEGLAGVREVDVDIELKQVHVDYDDAVVDRPGIVGILQELGYEATPVAADNV